jgi:putative addiction module component (TIGR02574 family)
MLSSAKRQIFDKALNLPKRDREALAEQLWHSLDEDLEELVEQRAKDMREGKSKGIPFKEVMAQLGQRRHGTSRKRRVS